MEMRDLMTDPTKVNVRIFVGSLPTDSMVNRDLEKLFEPYGPIEGVLLNRGFGFVQFKNESSAKDAAAVPNLIYRGRKIDIKPARPLHKRLPYNPHNQHEKRERSPLGDREFIDKGREPSRFPVRERSFPALPAPVQTNPDRTNDCEIIVVNKNQTEYAEYIEHKLRRSGLTVDLLFPNEDVPVMRVLSNISNRGCLFAVVIMPQNEEHRSITINILHGPQQEHRNMPLEDAIALVTSSFEEYLKKEKAARPTAISIAAAPTDRHPETVQVLLNLLADNRSLTVVQYDRIISYLQGRREIQVKVELGDSAPPPPPTQDVQQILQSRILSILNTKGSSAMDTTQVPVPTPKPATPLLNDPAVQLTLTNLIQGDLLRKLSEPR